MCASDALGGHWNWWLKEQIKTAVRSKLSSVSKLGKPCPGLCCHCDLRVSVLSFVLFRHTHPGWSFPEITVILCAERRPSKEVRRMPRTQPSVWSWANYLTRLSLNFFIHTMGDDKNDNFKELHKLNKSIFIKHFRAHGANSKCLCLSCLFLFTC